MIYDLANTIFVFGVVGLYFPRWMQEGGFSDSSLAVTEAIAGLLVVLLAPWVGAHSDLKGRRIPALAITTVIAVGATSLLASLEGAANFILLGMGLVGFNVGGAVYDALLPTVSTIENRGRVSGMGVAVGYVGSFIGLGIGRVTLQVLDTGYASTFRALAAGFLIFALPAFFLIREKRSDRGPASAGMVLTRLILAWKGAAEVPGLIRFLAGRFLYTDAINTLIGGFLAIFAITELGFEEDAVDILIGVAIVTAIFGGAAGGRLVGRLGSIRTLRLVLVAWMVALGSGVVAAVADLQLLAWVVTGLGGAALGATWASDRVLMIELSPPARLGEFYGLYATVGRFATVAGPLAWALVVDLLRWGRPAAMGVLILFVLFAWRVLRPLQDRARSGQI